MAAANPEVASEVYDTGLHIPVNPFVTKRPHSGVGFVDYLLVLTDRVGPGNDGSDPTPWVAWLAPASSAHTMVEDGATVWQWRSPRAIERGDPHRPLAPVRPRPGGHRSPTGPTGRPGMRRSPTGGNAHRRPDGIDAEHAAAGGGLCFSDVGELLGAVASLEDRGVRDQLGKQGRTMAEDRYGHPDRLVDRMAHIVAAVEKAGPRRNRRGLGLQLIRCATGA